MHYESVSNSCMLFLKEFQSNHFLFALFKAENIDVFCTLRFFMEMDMIWYNRILHR